MHRTMPTPDDVSRPALPAACSSSGTLSLSVKVERALQSTAYSALRGVRVSVHDEVVVLRGRVPTFHMKQIAQAAAGSVPGVREVRNELDVAGPR